MKSIKRRGGGEMNKRKQNIELKFSDGAVSEIDERVHRLILSYQREIQSLRKTLPAFYDLAENISNTGSELLNFYNFLLNHRSISRSQLFQDLFVLFIHEMKTHGTFLEFGATNGIELSNSLMLEREFSWTGVLVEPSPQWHPDLSTNRPDAVVLDSCIFTETGKQLDFFVSDAGVLSTLDEFRESDASTMPGNAKVRNQSGYHCKVTSISLNDVMLKHFGGNPIDFMSVDTEGSEFLILQEFDFNRYAPKVVTVEHNFSENQKRLDDLFKDNGYVRYFEKFTQFDAWYVLAR